MEIDFDSAYHRNPTSRTCLPAEMGETPAPDVTRVERPASRPSDWESVGKEHRGRVRPNHHAPRNAPSPPRLRQTPSSPRCGSSRTASKPSLRLGASGRRASGSSMPKPSCLMRRNASPPTDTAPPRVKGSREAEGRTRQVKSRRKHLTTDPRPKYLTHSPTSEKDVTLTKHLIT
jgi:hypothetical protein